MYKAAIVGCGRIGCTFSADTLRPYASTHAAAYQEAASVKLAALCDTDESRLQQAGEQFSIDNLYTDCAEMLGRNQIDILSICTPPTVRLEVVKCALVGGVKAIYCEKPIATSVIEGKAIVNLCKKRGVLLTVNHQRRFSTLHQNIAEFIACGELGYIQQVTCYYGAGVSNSGTHLFDLLRFYLDNVEWVQGRQSANSSGKTDDVNIDGVLKFKSGMQAVIQACDSSHYSIFEIILVGTKGRIHVTNSGYEAYYEEVKESTYFSGHNELFPAPLPFDTGDNAWLLRGVEHIVECLNTNTQPVSTGQDGLESLRIINALLESADNGGKQCLL